MTPLRLLLYKLGISLLIVSPLIVIVAPAVAILWLDLSKPWILMYAVAFPVAFGLSSFSSDIVSHEKEKWRER